MPLPVFDEKQYEYLLGQKRKKAAATLSQQYNINEAEKAALPGQTNLINARRGANQAKAGTLAASAGVIAASRGVNAAQAGVLGREQEQLGATRGLISLSQQQAGARQQDISLIRGARDNVGDKVAVAKEAQNRAVEDERLYGRLGVDAPVNVDVPAGSEGGVGLGQRASLKTQEDIVRGQAADREADRAAVLENAKLAVQMQATNVTEAELMARRAGLTLADARLMVDDAQLREGYAGLAVSEAGLQNDESDVRLKGMGLDLDTLKLNQGLNAQYLDEMKAPTDQGYELYTDPVTRERSWRTPAEADQLEYDYNLSLSKQRIPGQISLSRAKESAEAQAEGLGGLTPAKALELLATGKLPPGISEQAIMNSLVKNHNYDPNIAFNLVADAKTKGQAASNPFVNFDDSDFVTYLVPGLAAGRPQDSSQPNPFDTRVSQIRGALEARYPNNPQVVQTKLIQYINAAKAQHARLKDEASGGLQR